MKDLKDFSTEAIIAVSLHSKFTPWEILHKVCGVIEEGENLGTVRFRGGLSTPIRSISI